MSLYNVSTTPICLNSLIVNVNYFFLLEVNNFKHKKLKYIKKKKKKIKKKKKNKSTPCHTITQFIWNLIF